jgi:hypothetical protein
MLDENVANQFKVSKVPTLTGWNMSMSIREMLDQLKGIYGKTDTMMLFANDMLFCSPFNPIDAPEALFYRLEKCQEIQVLAHDPYSDMQVINNAVHLLMQASIFLLKEFDNREAITPKIYPALKTFIAAAYTRHILGQQLHNTAGKQGYTPTSHNMYKVFVNEDNTDTTATTTMNIVALATGSTITAAILDSVANTINQLSANQTVLMNQMAAMLYANVPPLQPYNTNHQSNNAPFQCSNLLPGLHWVVSTMEMEEVAGGGASDRGAADVGAGVINAPYLQTLDATKVSEMSAEAAVAGEFHRPQERLIHRRQLLCHLMHGTFLCLS